ncbi:MAG TPA: hypothetical protein VN704_03600 [Verrucomicrobiae bacterium]|nr:hypothetical protein [Verrucomicrobiae bacterium]
MSYRNRTFSSIIEYGLNLYFLDLSFGNVAKALSFLKIPKISYILFENRYKSTGDENIQGKRKSKCIKYENTINAGAELIWIWKVIELTNKEILSFYISKERNMFIVERSLSKVVKEYGLNSISSHGGT